MADNENTPTGQDPQSVDPLLVNVKTRETENPDIQVKLEVPHTDLAGIRADDPPAVAAQKIERANEQVRELQKAAGSEAPAPAGFDPESTDQRENAFASAGTNKTADGPRTVRHGEDDPNDDSGKKDEE